MACREYAPVSVGLASGYHTALCAFPGTNYVLVARTPVGLDGAEFSLLTADGQGAATLLDTDLGPPFFDHATSSDFDFEIAHPLLSGRGHRGIWACGDSDAVWYTSRIGVFGHVRRTGDTIDASGIRNAWAFELFGGSGPIPLVGDFTNSIVEGSRGNVATLGAGTTGRGTSGSHVALLGENDFSATKGLWLALYSLAGGLAPVSAFPTLANPPPGWPTPTQRFYAIGVPGGADETILVVEDSDVGVWGCVLSWDTGDGTVTQSAWVDITPAALASGPGYWGNGSFLYEADSAYAGGGVTRLALSFEAWTLSGGWDVESHWATFEVSGGAFVQTGELAGGVADYRAASALWSGDARSLGLFSSSGGFGVGDWRFSCASPTLSETCPPIDPGVSIGQGPNGLYALDAHGALPGAFGFTTHTTSLVGSVLCGPATTPPLRRRQRDDGARRSRIASSKQASVRRGRGNTYW